MEKCIFCGWTRKTAYPSIRFFGLPREPGMKRIQWLYVLGNREIQPKDRVCSVHFRSGRPSSDPSHEDFVPHLYLNNEPPPEVLRYLESLAETKLERAAAYETPHPQQSRSLDAPLDESAVYSEAPDVMQTRAPGHTKTRPSILQRRRKAPSSQESSSLPIASKKEELLSPPPTPLVISDMKVVTADEVHGGSPRPMKRIKLQILEKPLIEAAGVRPGQTVIIKKRFLKKCNPPSSSEPRY
uniref:THAP-type domain-containing protein n=1 Tax=Steinernema glaseri TaxID=37863 RepID=A0A1I7ZUM7_9BILA